MKKLIRTLPVVAIGVCMIGSATHAAEPGIGEVSGFAGPVSIRDGGGTHGNFGGTMGANLGRFVHLFGEANYMALGKKTTGVSGRVMNYGGGVQIRIPTGESRIEPYGLLTFGYGQMKGATDANSDSRHNAYNAVGLGTRVFIGRKWGVKPEFRYQKYYGINLSSNDPVIDRARVITATAGVFFQFGGK